MIEDLAMCVAQLVAWFDLIFAGRRPFSVAWFACVALRHRCPRGSVVTAMTVAGREG